MSGKFFRGIKDEDRQKRPAASLGAGISKGTEADYGEHGNKIGHLGRPEYSSGSSGSAGGFGYGGLGAYAGFGGLTPGSSAGGTGSGSSSAAIAGGYKHTPYAPSDAVLAAQKRLEELQPPGD